MKQYKVKIISGILVEPSDRNCLMSYMTDVHPTINESVYILGVSYTVNRVVHVPPLKSDDELLVYVFVWENELRVFNGEYKTISTRIPDGY